MLLVERQSGGRRRPADRRAMAGDQPDRAADNLQVRLSELRKALRSAGEDDRLATRPPGYLLRVSPGELDALRFEQLAAEGARRWRPAMPPPRRSGSTRRLALWRGPALADLDDVPFGAGRGGAPGGGAAGRAGVAGRGAAGLRPAPATSSPSWRRSPRRIRCASGSGCSGCSRCTGPGARPTRCAPTASCATILVDELGIEPGPELRDLHARILRQDPALDRPDRPPPGRAPVRPRRRPGTPRPADGIHIAYQVLGEGERDIVFVPGLMSHLELLWERPGDRRVLPAPGRAGPADPVRQAGHRAVGPRPGDMLAGGAHGRRAGGDARGRLEPGRAVRLLRGRADEHPVRRHLPRTGHAR